MAIPQWPSILDALTLLLYVAMVALLMTIFSDSQMVLDPVALSERRDRRHRAFTERARTDISSLALLVSALFWTWLWGPMGWVLSTPLTVCLAVLGKHMPRLKWLAVLLGDDPALG